MVTKVVNPFGQIRNASDLAGKAYNAFSWYQSKIKNLGGPAKDPSQLLSMKTKDTKFTTRLQPGSMYLYNYDPKYKETLPYYDMFPLVFPFSTFKGGFIGLNLHYLPYGARFKLMEKLMEFATDTTINDKTKLAFSYQLLNSSAKFKEFKSCVKQYLTNHVRTRFMLIDPQDWLTAVMLPVDRFVKAGKNTVWADSMAMISK